MAVLRIILFFSFIRILLAFTCPGSYKCSCAADPRDGGYDLMCPEHMNTAFNIKYKPYEYVTVDCSYTATYGDYKLLQDFRFGVVNFVSFRFCQLPNGTFRDILESMGITVNDVSAFSFTSYQNLTNTLRRDCFGGMSNLTMAVLRNNGLTEIPPELFKDMPKLKSLDLSQNRVTLKPKMFFYNPLLTALELGSNNFHSLPVTVFENLRNLKLLNMENNRLTNLTRSHFMNLKKLEGLDLYGNDFVTLPEDLFYDLQNLKNISLFYNDFDYLPGGLFRENLKLERLKLYWNRKNLTELSSSLLQVLPNLLELYLHHIGLKKISNDFFWGLSSITNITLARNHLESLPWNLFRDTKQLHNLDLDNNKLTHLPDTIFQNVSKLQVLKLRHNKLKAISHTLFSNQLQLKILKMSHNELETIKRGTFEHTVNLQEVDLAYNRLNLSNFPPDFSPFLSIQLVNLNLSHNFLTEIKNDWVITLLNLQKLDLSYNNISRVTETDLQFISGNIKVDLQYNNIKTIDFRRAILWPESDKPYSSNNVQIYVDNNNLVCDCNILEFVQYLNGDLMPYIKDRFQLHVGDLTCAAPVNLFGQRVRDVSYHALRCNITYDCPKPCTCANSRYDRATIVHCQGKNLTDFPKRFPDVQSNNHTVFHLENNSIQALKGFHYRGQYNNVTELYLTNNIISTINVTSIPLEMQKLYLDNNNISKISAEALTFFENCIQASGLQTAFKGNPWLCNCDNVAFHQFLLKYYNYVTDYNNITCRNSGVNFAAQTPEELCPTVTLPITIVCALSVLFVVIAASLAVAYYRNQQTVKVWLYAHQMCLWFVTETEIDKDKVYDAFVSYSHKDEEYVINELVPGLENGEPSYRLCIHIRDWMAGEWIPDQIVQSVEESRRTIVILSKNFIESVWGRLEFKAAHNQALQDKTNRVIIIVYGEIPSKEEVDDDLQLYMNMNTYLKWDDPWFWQKLRYAMPHQQKQLSMRKRKKKQIHDKVELISANADTEISVITR